MEREWIDLHAHILPGLDDGAQSMEDALEMAAMAAESGVHTIVATPHSHPQGELPPRFASIVESRVRELQYRLRCEGIPLRLLPGMEIFATPDTGWLLSRGELLTLNGTRYALVEFRFDEDTMFMEEILQQVTDRHLVPIVAHPERYFAVQQHPQRVADWLRMGYGIQVNKGSLLGRFGSEAQDLAVELIRRRMATVIASDAHYPHMRTPEMASVAEALSHLVPPEEIRRLLTEFPRRLLNDELLKEADN